MSYGLGNIINQLMEIRNQLSSLLGDILHDMIDVEKAKTVVSNAIYDLSIVCDRLEKISHE
jgi:hypothetical protein